MEKELEKVSSGELNELYAKTKEFISYLDKEFKETEKMKGEK